MSDAETKTRPFLVAQGLGTLSPHLALRGRVALCGGELEPGSFRWAPWSRDGRTLLLPYACERCHEILLRLDDKTWQAVMSRQVTLSARMRIDVPPPEELGFVVTEAPDDRVQLTDQEILAAEEIVADLFPNEFYVLTRPTGHIYVKEAEFFEEQGGLEQPWGKAWQKVRALDIADAREVAKKAWLRSVDPLTIEIPVSLTPGAYSQEARERINEEARRLRDRARATERLRKSHTDPDPYPDELDDETA